MQRHRARADEIQLGLAWYTREGWERLRALAADREALDDSFEEWERGALAAIFELEAAGRSVRKVSFDTDTLAAWCREQHRPLDAAARAEYVTHLLSGP